MGRQVGNAVYERSQFYINGGVETETLDFEGEDLSAGTTITDQFYNLKIRSDELPVIIFDTLGNVLILSEDGDASDPDDSSTGGTIYFDWHNPVDIKNASLLDIESAGGSIVLYDSLGLSLGSYDTSYLTPDGGTATVNIDLQNVSRLELNLVSSGAIASIDFAQYF